jgi:uncharacterized protein (TIGR02117 family)
MEMKKLARRIGRVVIRFLAIVVALPVVYFVAALILGLVPANVGWQEPERGVEIFVRTNGVHTWIVVPKINAIMDWRPYAPGEHVKDPRYGNADHVAFGYGNREFYLNTPTWGDLSPRTAALALFGSGPTLLHVEHDHQPRPDQDTRPLTITPDQYRRLAAYIRARFRLDGNGETMPLIGRGYNRWDVFYEAQGGYSFVMTCNEWTGRALRHAGIRTGLWTPLSQNIMWRLD